MHSSLLGGGAFSVTVFDEAAILGILVTEHMVMGLESTCSLLTPFSPNANQSIMVFFNMQIQEMLCWEIPPAFQTAIHMGFRIMHIIVFERCKREVRSMAWEGASHFSFRSSCSCFTAIWVEVDEFWGIGRGFGGLWMDD
jgi:hypothetical protein